MGTGLGDLSIFLDTHGVLLTPVKGLGDADIHSARLAFVKVRGVGQALLEELLGVGDGPVLEEFVAALLEPMVLTIVDKHGALVDNLSLREILLRVHHCEQKCGDHRENEEANDGVILVHILASLCDLFLGAANHGYNHYQLLGNKVDLTYPLWPFTIYSSCLQSVSDWITFAVFYNKC